MKAFDFSGLACLFLAGSLLAGCAGRDTLQRGRPVSFRCAEGAATRAGYTGVMVGSREVIDWDEGDRIRVWCSQASAPASFYADYALSNVSRNGGSSVADMAAVGDGLLWGDPQKHVFCAVWPAPSASSSVTALDGAVMSGSVAASQSGSALMADGLVLAAHEEVIPSEFVKGAVFLRFRPLCTVITFEVSNGLGDDVVLSSVALRSGSHPLSGGYRYTIGGGCIVDGDVTEAERTVVVSGERTLSAGKADSYTFTFILRPDEDLDDLVLVLNARNGAVFESGIRGAEGAYTFASGSKTVVRGVVFEKWLNLETVADMGSLDLAIRQDEQIGEKILF